MLNIEKELARIQTEIDVIEGRRKTIIGNVEYSNVDITLKQKRVLGPLGYIGKGLFWVVGKLFVVK